MNHLVNHRQRHDLVSSNTLHVIGVVSNPARWHSRYRLAREFAERMRNTANVELHIVEAQHGDRHHEIAGDGDLRLRAKSEIWIKENMINLGARQLPSDWKYMAWVDMDVEFRDPHWAQETLHQLQTFEVVQPWEQCVDLGPHGNILQTFQSFGSVHQKGVTKQRKAGEPYQYAHTGYAWACTRRFWEQTGGLLDGAILGSGDHHMAWAMIGEVESSIHGKSSAAYRKRCLEWQQRAMRVTHGQVGFTPGRIEHHWHGSKKNRFYKERWQILVDNSFCPDADLMRDDQGLLYLVGKPALENDIRKYNRSRLEDSIDE